MGTRVTDQAVVGELRRVAALFQARSIAAILNAPPPRPEAFRKS